MNKLFSKSSLLIFLILVSLVTIFPLFQNGYFPMHDDTQPSRVFEMSKELMNGVWPVRWVPDLGYGYGYPLFNFYAPLSYYFGGLVNIFISNPIIATKAMMGVGMILAGVFMFAFSGELIGGLGGFIAALLYAFAPYHALDLYVRGDVAELWAYAFIPLVFLGFYYISKHKKSGLVLGSFGLAFVILSHNLTAFMLSPFLIAYLVFLTLFGKNKKQLVINFAVTLFLAFALAAFYWIPAILELNNTNVVSQISGSADFRNHFVCFSQLWDSPWGFGGSAPGCADGLSFRLGKLHVLVVFLSLVFIFFKKRKLKKSYLTEFFILGFIFSVIMTTDISRPIWQLIPQLSYLQYPWRFLIFSSFFSSLLGGYFLVMVTESLKKEKYKKIAFFILIAATLLLYSKLFNPQYLNNKQNDNYVSKEALNWDISKISDEYLPRDFKKPSAFLDIPGGSHVVSSSHLETPVERTSDFISLAGLAILILVILTKRTYE